MHVHTVPVQYGNKVARVDLRQSSRMHVLFKADFATIYNLDTLAILRLHRYGISKIKVDS